MLYQQPILVDAHIRRLPDGRFVAVRPHVRTVYVDPLAEARVAVAIAYCGVMVICGAVYAVKFAVPYVVEATGTACEAAGGAINQAASFAASVSQDAVTFVTGAATPAIDTVTRTFAGWFGK